jgi:hypothetical protein
MPHDLCLSLDTFEPRSAAALLPAVAARGVYVVDGSLAIRGADGGTALTLGANSGAQHAAECRIGAGHLAARVLRWELVPTDADVALPTAQGATTRLLLRAPMTLDASRPWLLRCDRVDFPPGGEALTHTHQGGGIRCLLVGSIRIDTQGHSTTYGPMGAWFEAGPDPVYAAADAQAPSAFARCMVLPAALLGGKSSISYVRQEDLDKPKSQRYQVFVDHPIPALA